MNAPTRLILVITATSKSMLQVPLFAMLIGAALGSIGYGGMMSLLVWLAGIPAGTASWAALLFGFPALFLIPSSIDETWSTQATLILIFFIQGALWGGLIGLLARSMCINKFPQSDIEDVLRNKDGS